MQLFDIPAMPPEETYHLLTSLVTPRPIGWVSTVSPDGIPNIAPFGCYGSCSFNPPVVYVTDNGSTTDTLRNIRATREFVCNVVSYDHVQAMNFSAINFPSQENEFEWAGLTSAPSHKVAPPGIAEVRAVIECRLRQFVELGPDTMILGDVVAVRVDPGVMRNGRVEPDLLRPVGRYSGNRYAEGTELYRLPRVTWDELSVWNGERKLPRFNPGQWVGADSVTNEPPFYGPRKSDHAD